MKVDSSPDSYIGSVAGGPQKSAAAAGAAAKPQASAGVTVTLSSSTTQALSGAGGSSSDVFNSEKVESMKAAIANGTFQVNAEAIADKMLSNAAEMLNSSSGAAS
jgi:negative regulator of flagellin synthesis FlgM